ncbi:MAG: LamG-like jellyroll fold domain-containing protein [Verrucomicrobiales bacterium]
MKHALPILLAGLSPLSASTLLYWDGTSNAGGNQLLDQSGNGIHGNRSQGGTGTWEIAPDGGPGGAGDSYLNLDSGADDSGNYARTHFSFPTTTHDLSNQSWAVSGWFDRSGTDLDMIFNFGGGDGYGGENELYLYGNATDQLALHHFAGSGNQQINLATTYNTGEWNSYVINFTASGLNDGKGTLGFYHNGALVGSDSTFTFNMVQSRLNYGGTGNTGTESRNYNGGLDDFALYTRTLTTEEITGLHNRTITPLQIPEPGSLILLFGAGLLPLTRRKR